MSFATPAADRTWFDFSLQDAPEDTEFGVYAFSGRERLNEPYLFVVELVNSGDNRDMTHCLGKKARLSIRDHSGGTRQVHGSILRMDQLHTANRFTHYRCELVPAFRFLEFTQEHKIFQHLTVSQIIDRVLFKHHFPVEAYDFYLHGKYQAREYCVQYGESDLHFISRLCEEEGISFSFDHSGDREKICFSDAWGGRPISGDASIRFYPGSGHREDTAVISRLTLQRRIVSDQSTYQEWDFTHPSLDMTGHDEEPDWRQAPVPPAMQLETYQFPHLYQSPAEGARYAFLQLKRQLTWSTWIEVESDASRFVPGFLFSLHGHPRQDVNRQWTIVEVEHTGKQPGALRQEAPEDRGLEYQAKVTAIPHDVRFIPEVRHPKKRINGLQSALVTGPQSEEVYCDKYGRVKVRFHWDRLGTRNENTTCWIRAAGLLAGAHFGSVHLPRVGQEVMVEFMEGDPDRPVITGRWYNADHMPPWQQPGQKTLSGIQSREFGSRGRNQLVFDDTKGQIQAQLSSDHGLSQLNLGHLTRINHGVGRKDFRGEGFELRTDEWGVIRAGRGLFLTSVGQRQAQGHHKTLEETRTALDEAADSHKRSVELAEKHLAQDEGTDGAVVARALRIQADEIRGPGMKHQEISAPHILFSSAEDAAFTAAGTGHWHSETDVAISADGHGSISAGGGFLASAMDKVRLFAHSLGMRFMAAEGKVQIQAQSADLDAIAAQVASLVSASGGIRISSPKTITLSAGGSYLKLGINGIEHGTAGAFTVHAANHNLLGPRDKDWLKPVLPQADGEREEPPHLLKFAFHHTPDHRGIGREKYTVFCKGEEFATGYTDENGSFAFEYDPEELEYDIELSGEHRFHIRVGETNSEGEDGLKERLLRDGFRARKDNSYSMGSEHIFRAWRAISGKGAKIDQEKSGGGGAS